MKRLQDVKEEFAETKTRDIELNSSNSSLVKEYEKIQTQLASVNTDRHRLMDELAQKTDDCKELTEQRQ